MSVSRQGLSENLVRLRDNGHWKYYVQMLETEYNEKVTALLNSDHPDEALRGECRAIMNQLRNINLNQGTPTS
jgi:hypothetical protein